MSVYPYVDRIKDPAARQAMRLLFDRLAAAETATNTTPQYVAPKTTVTGTGTQRITNLADPQHSTDAVNKRTLRVLIQTIVNDGLRRIGIPVGITARI